MRRIYSFALALLLLLGQVSLLAHEYDSAVHTHGGDCSICLHGAPLTHAAVGSFSLELALFSDATDFQPVALALTGADRIPYCARGPPSISSL